MVLPLLGFCLQSVLPCMRLVDVLCQGLRNSMRYICGHLLLEIPRRHAVAAIGPGQGHGWCRGQHMSLRDPCLTTAGWLCPGVLLAVGVPLGLLCHTLLRLVRKAPFNTPPHREAFQG